MRLIEKRLNELGIVLPEAVTPLQNYVPFVRTGNLLFIAGQLSFDTEGDVITGKFGETATLEQTHFAAERSALNVIAQIKSAIGNLDNVVRIVKLNGYIQAAPNAFELAQAMNGASDLMVSVFGEKGRHARTTIGVLPLPRNALCEVDAIVEIA